MAKELVQYFIFLNMDNLKQEIIIRKKKITNPIALGFVNAFLMHREINPFQGLIPRRLRRYAFIIDA